MFKSAIYIIFISILVLNSILTIILTIYAAKLIKIRTHLKAKKYTKLNMFCEKNKIIFIGDSLTEFYQTDEYFFNYEIYNRGIANDTSTGVLERLEDNVLKMEPSKVFLQIGTNDFKKNSINVEANIIKILNTMQLSLLNTKLYFISLYPINNKMKCYSRFFTNPRKNSMIEKLNSNLKAFCQENQITYIDVYNHLLDENGYLKSEYSIEGLHISFEGYVIITEILKPYLDE